MIKSATIKIKGAYATITADVEVFTEALKTANIQTANAPEHLQGLLKECYLLAALRFVKDKNTRINYKQNQDTKALKRLVRKLYNQIKNEV